MLTWPDIIEESWYYTDDEDCDNPYNLYNMPVIPFAEVLIVTGYNIYNGRALLESVYSEESGWKWAIGWSNCDDSVPAEEFVVNAYKYMFLYAPHKPKDGQSIEWTKYDHNGLVLMNSKDDILILRCRNKDNKVYYVTCTANAEEFRWIPPDGMNLSYILMECEEYAMVRFTEPE